MTRESKISLIKAIKSGRTRIKEIQIQGAVCPPTWLLNQFETEDELYQNLKKTWGDTVRVIYDKGEIFIVPPKKIKSKWFNNE